MEYIIITQVDITRTRPQRDDPDEFKQAQQSNFDTLLQAIELRSNIAGDKDPKVEEYEGVKWWHYEFTTEREDVYLKNGDPVGFLVDDLDGVPFISGLNNNVEFELNVFKTKSTKINTKVLIKE